MPLRRLPFRPEAVEQHRGRLGVTPLTAGQLRPLPTPEADETEFLTNFERKYRLEGRPIYRAMFEKGV